MKNSGPATVHFTDSDQKIRYHLPDTCMSGLIWGSTTLSLQNSMIFIDRGNKLKTHVTFDGDNFKGAIYKFNSSVVTIDNTISFSKVKDIEYEVSSLHGKWQQNLFIDGKQVWDFDSMGADGGVKQSRTIPMPNPLASDCRYREDLTWLRRGNIPNAEIWKEWLEEMQRHEAKLRKH